MNKMHKENQIILSVLRMEIITDLRYNICVQAFRNWNKQMQPRDRAMKDKRANEKMNMHTGRCCRLCPYLTKGNRNVEKSGYYYRCKWRQDNSTGAK